MGQLTTQQLATLKTELQNDPLALGYSAYLPTTDVINLAAMLDWLRDGATPWPGNSIVGPSGPIGGATNAAPIVITSAAHGRSTGDTVVITGVGGNTAANNIAVNPVGLPLVGAVAPNSYWTITVIDANTFSLQTSVGNGAFTSGGTWTWAAGLLANASKIFNSTIPVSQVIANLLPGDAAGATALAGVQAQILPAFLNPNGNIRLTDSSGNELNTVAWLNLLSQTGTVSHKAIKALETRFGSRGEQVLNLVSAGSPGQLLTQTDVAAAILGHY